MTTVDQNLYLLIIIVAFLVLLIVRVFFMYYSRAKKTPQKKTHTSPTQSLIITHPIVSELYVAYSQMMIGQQDVFIWLLWSWLARGHCLLTGLPGTGKTQAIKIFTNLLWLDLGRVQGTSDLLPADIVWSLVFNPKTSDFDTSFGPIMHECVLVDEINRMPSKTQSALLQAMAESSIVIGQTKYDLSDHFTVVATQNPYDRVGTFPLPQAQLDRFMCQVIVQAPDLKYQSQILQQQSGEEASLKPIASKKIKSLLEQYDTIMVPESVTTSVAHLIQHQWLSSRAGQQIIAFARAIALIQNKTKVDQTDIHNSLEYTIKHRLK